MNNLLDLVENQQTSEFYPTPQSLIEKMLAGIKWEYINTVLEPSAGKGDILKELAKKESYRGKPLKIVLRKELQIMSR